MLIPKGSYSSRDILKYDENNNLIYCKEYHNSIEHWYRYDKNNNMVYCKDTLGVERVWEFDENNRRIYYKNEYKKENWYEYDKEGKCKNITKEKILRNKFNRFEIMDI